MKCFRFEFDSEKLKGEFIVERSCFDGLFSIASSNLLVGLECDGACFPLCQLSMPSVAKLTEGAFDFEVWQFISRRSPDLIQVAFLALPQSDGLAYTMEKADGGVKWGGRNAHVRVDEIPERVNQHLVVNGQLILAQNVEVREMLTGDEFRVIAKLRSLPPARANPAQSARNQFETRWRR
jgi:hypothetical protein